jgi:3-deoxy-D-manno-octulosonate 8-phosphate phosphatase (KDO 8-P phosphatase)
MASNNLTQKIHKIRMIVCDVDGVLTDGKLYLTESGEQVKAFHFRDGMGIIVAKRAGILVAFVSAKSSAILRSRATELGVELVEDGAGDKKETALQKVVARAGVSLEEVAYVGDDLNDLAPMGLVGLSVAVGDAAQEVKEAADIVTQHPGGAGAVREIIEMLLKEQGSWEKVLASYRGRSA